MNNHVCCSACVVRFAPGVTTAHGSCPRCGARLCSLTPHDAIGYPLFIVERGEWAPAGLDALAHAVAGIRAGERTRNARNLPPFRSAGPAF